MPSRRWAACRSRTRVGTGYIRLTNRLAFIVPPRDCGARSADEAAFGRLIAELRQGLLKRGGGAAGVATAAEGGEVFDFRGVGDFRERFDTDGRSGDQQKLVADPDELHLLPAGERRATEELDGFFGQAVPRRPA